MYAPWLGKFERYVARKGRFIAKLRINRGGGVVASVFIVLAAASYGIVTGGHIDPVTNAVKDVRDGLGRAFGFRIATIGFFGNKHLNREEILARAGITGTSSLLFFDVTDARARLMADPRVSDATLLKLYPDRLQISIVERQPFALWQIDRQVSVVAEDGTVLAPFVSKEYLTLPMFVGRGAEKRGKELLAVLDRFPEIRDNLRASILVAERRWNLRLKNGLDVKLPEDKVERALAQLVSLDREKKILSRDIVSIDLREGNRVSVQLSEAAAAARDAALKEKAKQKKGGSA
ncbi:MAG TPA: cell division protein FtsQ/DivIB [Xanthobacteraceae bacterium]|nr:cell division protein FtsQ/DivIB [Xanthobacteraceae bacterium]